MARRKKTIQPKPVKQSPAKPAPTRTQPKTLCMPRPGEIVFILIGIGIALIPFAVGKYIEFNSPNPYDSALNVYTAQSLLDGQKVGEDIDPSARPNTILVNIVGIVLFGYREFGPKFVQMILQIAALGMMFYTLRRCFGPLPAVGSLILAAFYLSCPPFLKSGNAKEQFMIPFMIMAVCSLILSYYRKHTLWLYLCGAFAINTFYFKQTGFSVVGAIGVFLLVRTLTGRQSWGDLGYQVSRMFVGALAGLVPLGIYFIWQDLFGRFISEFPAVVVMTAAAIVIVIWLIRWGPVMSRLRAGFVFLKRFSRRLPGKLIALGCGGVLIIMVLTALVFHFCEAGQGVHYIKDVWFVSLFLSLVRDLSFLMHNIVDIFDGIFSSRYVRSSRLVSDFQAQYDWIFGYYRDFVVLIGLCVFAAVVAMVHAVRNRRSAKMQSGRDQAAAGVQAGPGGERFVLLLILWWLLDSLFIWISPRSYVEYFLPQAASGAFLAGYSIYYCRQHPRAILWLLGIWIVLGVQFNWVSPGGTFPFIGFRDIQPGGSFWENWGAVVVGAMVLAAAAGIRQLVLKQTAVAARFYVLAALAAVSMLFWSGHSFAVFDQRLENIENMKQANRAMPWVQVADFIRQNSRPDDQIFVWGWYPGIYVQAQRTAPVSVPAFSDMHILQPESLERVIGVLVQELQASPPRFIVDSQKIHFPYWEHPTFDLWPRWRNNQTGQPFFRFHHNEPLQPNALISISEWEQYREIYYRQLEAYTRQLLMLEQRKGGPMDAAQAAERAETERLRHEVMEPLRQFVMEHYQPANYLPANIPPSMYLYVRKP